MWKSAVAMAILAFWCTVECRPNVSIIPANFSKATDGVDDVDLPSQDRARRVVTYPSNFKFMYVGQSGQIVENHKPSTGHWIEIVGSPQVSHNGLYTTALEVSKMLRHSPSHIFTNIANHPGSGVGVFTLAEKITVFPECYHLADTPACKGRCDGSCSHTCTFDGRKYETLSGVTNSKSIVAVENVLCASRDPYHHHDNILVHEFAHTVNRLGMSSSEKSQLTAAYNHAKAHHLWRDGSYAMATQGEYFAEGTGAFFLVNLQSTTGGMTDCSGGKCRTEMQARDHIQAKDPQLATILSHVYTNGHIHTASGIKVCPT